MIAAARLALALSPLMAFWAVAASIASLRTGRADLAGTAYRGIVAAMACAWISVAILVAALFTGDLSVRFVADQSSVLIPGRYLVASLLSAPGGALLAWSALAGTLWLGAAAPGRRGDARTWGILVIGATTGAALLLVSAMADPFASILAPATDGAGLSPDLQRGGAVLHAVALLVGAAAALPAFAITIASLAVRELDDQWNAAIRRWNAIVWSALFFGAVAGARWFALNPARGAWLADGETSAWLLPVVVGAWLLHLDAGRATAERVTMRVVLVIAIFVASSTAMALTRGAFVHGAASGPRLGAGTWFAIVPVAALAVAMWCLQRGRATSGALAPRATFGALARRATEPPPRAAVAGWVSHAGFILVLGAAVGSAFTVVNTVSLADAGVFRARDPFGHQWTFASQGVSTMERANYMSLTMSLMPERDGSRLAMLSAEARSYFRDGNGDAPGVAGFTSGTSKSAFLETRLSIEEPDATPPRIRITFVPLATWIWPGAVLLVLGTLVPLVGRGASGW